MTGLSSTKSLGGAEGSMLPFRTRRTAEGALTQHNYLTPLSRNRNNRFYGQAKKLLRVGKFYY